MHNYQVFAGWIPVQGLEGDGCTTSSIGDIGERNDGVANRVLKHVCANTLGGSQPAESLTRCGR